MMASLPIDARRHPLVAEVRKRFVDRCGFPGERLVIGVSGGADSLALLIACCAIRSHAQDALKLEPIAVHVHHHLRESADDDAAHVAWVCEHLGVPHRCAHVHVDTTGNLAAEARRVRYEALRTAAEATQCATVAVAHHAEDQFETMLMALGRGAGVDGLSGMAWRRPLGNDIVLLRPLLGVRKAACEKLCAAAGLTWRDDPTNRDRARARNRLRHDVLPVMESLWPGSAERAIITADLLREAAMLLEREVEAVFGPPQMREWSRDELKQHRPALLAAGLRKTLAQVHVEETVEPATAMLFRAAEAIGDDEVRPRRYQFSDTVELLITSRSVTLKTRAQ